MPDPTSRAARRAAQLKAAAHVGKTTQLLARATVPPDPNPNTARFLDDRRPTMSEARSRPGWGVLATGAILIGAGFVALVGAGIMPVSAPGSDTINLHALHAREVAFDLSFFTLATGTLTMVLSRVCRCLAP